MSQPKQSRPSEQPLCLSQGQPESAPPRKRQRLVKAGARARQEAPAAMPRPEDLDEDANIAAIMGAEMDAEYENDPQAEVNCIALQIVLPLVLATIANCC